MLVIAAPFSRDGKGGKEGNSPSNEMEREATLTRTSGSPVFDILVKVERVDVGTWKGVIYSTFNLTQFVAKHLHTYR